MKQNKIAVFATDGLVGHSIRSYLIPALIEMGMEPVLYSVGKPKRIQKLNQAVLDINFIDENILTNVVFPYLDSHPPLKTNDGELYRDMFYTNRQLADHYGFEFYEGLSPNDADVIDRVKNDPEITGGLSIRNYHVLKNDIIEAFGPDRFLWNIHGGKLPEYKGLFIPFYMLENGETNYGWSLHCIDRGIDTGAVIDTIYQDIDKNRDLFETYLSMAPDGADMIENAVRKFHSEGQINTERQSPHVQGGYYPFPSDENFKRWETQGIVYSSYHNLPDIYANAFAHEGTSRHTDIRNLVIQALANRFRKENTAISTPQALTP